MANPDKITILLGSDGSFQGQLLSLERVVGTQLNILMTFAHG